MDKYIVTIFGIVGIIFTYWFFFGKKEEASEASNHWDILVDGGYKPNRICIKNGKSATLTITRKDPNPCLEEIIFPDYKIKEYLPLNKPIKIILNPPHHKSSKFHCGMNMYHGKIEISEKA